MAEYWICEGQEEETLQKVRAMMTGPLTTTIEQQPTKKLAAPWWWGNDEDVTTGNMRAMQQLKRR